MSDLPKRPWSKRAPAGATYDDLVIGSGIGGMTTAAMLAKLGRRVLVLEQHYVPGGYTHAFLRKGYRWDVGVHLVGEVGPQALPGRLLAALTEGRLQWAHTGPVYDTFHLPDGRAVAFPDSPKAFAQTLKEAFPEEAAGIDAYLADVRKTVSAMRSWYLGRVLPGRLGRAVGGFLSRGAQQALSETAETVVGRHLRDPRLRALVTAQWGYHGSPPHEASWALHALVVRHFLYGAYYPVGGAQQIALALLQTVADAGGWTRICADVEGLLVEEGRAVGVRMKDGETIRANRVVSAIGAGPTVRQLLPEALRQEGWVQSLSQLKPSAAHVCLYLGFSGDIEAAGATRSSQWDFSTWDHAQGVWSVHPDQPPSRPAVTFTSFPSLKDPHHDPGPDQHHTGEIITFVPYEAFARWQGTPWRKRGADYERFKAALTEQLLAVVLERLPGLKPLLRHVELATPLSTEHFVRPLAGSIYGLAGTPERYNNPWLRPASPIPGLYLSGSDVSSCGVVGAMMGGALCALAMEPIAGMRLLRGLSQPPLPSPERSSP
jgi:all-trans-retinol 13,14-reductase